MNNTLEIPAGQGDNHQTQSNSLHPYSSYSETPRRRNTISRDPRSSSQQSLNPAVYGDEEYGRDKRTLYLVYVHGFMGNETSFQSFPAHLHNILRLELRETHDVYTKIYPKFKTRHHITVATENLSQWLKGIENDSTDLVLLGHSMGGLICSELSFLRHEQYPSQPRHRLLGVISFDVPYYGLHPGVIGSGIMSIFKPAAPPPPRIPFAPAQPSAWENTRNFFSKYHDDLPKASGKWLMSHMEFGGTLTDWKGLKARYKKVQELERGEDGYRVRFVNYYTLCYGEREEEDLSSRVATLAIGSIPSMGLPPGTTLANDMQVVSATANRPSIEISSGCGSIQSTPAVPQSEPPEDSPQLPERPPTNASKSDSNIANEKKKAMKKKKKKDRKPRKFCLIPSEDPRNLWVPVPMYVDSEVTAHCSLFFITSESYQFLLEDTADRIKIWLQEMGDEMLARELSNLG